jgi:hypothetical protein
VHGILDTVECNYDGHYVFGMALDDVDVSSLCDISGLSISGRQFFSLKESVRVRRFSIKIPGLM